MMNALARKKNLLPSTDNLFDDFLTADLSATFRSLMNEVFADRSRVFDVFENSAKYPKADARQTQNGLEIDLAIPGCEKDEVDIFFADGILTVKHEKSQKNESKKEGKFLFNELRHSSWRRAWKIPQEIKEEEISASIKNGILTISVPYSQPEVTEKPGPRKISISDQQVLDTQSKDKPPDDIEITEKKEE